MIRLLFLLVFGLVAALLLLLGNRRQRSTDLPVFLRSDTIAGRPLIPITIHVHSRFQPTGTELEQLKADYSSLWAHLNYLYATGDVEAGKEYYTEGWFQQITHHYEKALHTGVTRSDLHHELHIQNWSSDGLVCAATDSNVRFSYVYPDQRVRTTKATIALILLYQGDHWRLDALRVLDEAVQME